MYNKTPKLSIIDKPNLSLFYVRYYDPKTKKQNKLTARYGNTHTKEEALMRIEESRDRKMRELEEDLRQIKEAKEKGKRK